MIATATSVREVISRLSFRAPNEAFLQGALAAALTEAGFSVHTEVALSRRDRIDLLVDRVGIEVKMKGSAASVAWQLQRYAASDLIDELVLVSTKAAHCGFLGREIGGKPLITIWACDL